MFCGGGSGVAAPWGVSLISELAASLGLDPVSARVRLEEGAAASDRSYRRSWRETYVAATADHRIRRGEAVIAAPEYAVEMLPFSAFAEYSHRVWSVLGHVQPLYVSEVSSLSSAAASFLADTDASARWDTPPADAMGVQRTGGLAGTTGIVAYLDVQAAGQVRMVALHEIAHLLCDENDGPQGHDVGWAETYTALLQRFLDDVTAAAWAFEWTWWLNKAVEHIRGDPDWLMDGDKH